MQAALLELSGVPLSRDSRPGIQTEAKEISDRGTCTYSTTFSIACSQELVLIIFAGSTLA